MQALSVDIRREEALGSSHLAEGEMRRWATHNGGNLTDKNFVHGIEPLRGAGAIVVIDEGRAHVLVQLEHARARVRHRRDAPVKKRQVQNKAHHAVRGRQW